MIEEIRVIGWDNLTQEMKDNWLLGSYFLLLASDQTLTTSDGLLLSVGTGANKGVLNDYDLNRWIDNYTEVKNRSIATGITRASPNVLTPFSRGDYLTLDSINDIKENIQEYMIGEYLYTDTPTLNFTSVVDFQDANNVEKILFDLYEQVYCVFRRNWRDDGVWNDRQIWRD
jgi:hypothetical protein